MEQICYSCFSDSLNEAGVCTRCGYDGAKNREKFPQALPQGSILYGRYIVGRVLGQGGFGITYLAQDYQTKELVAIKEFFPDTMATRTGGNTVTPFTGERGENFTYGRDTFLEEAKTMAEFLDNPNIVRVHSYFEENGTGYFVMEYLDGVSFQQYIKDHGGRISWEEALKIMLPILDALSAIHAKGIIHRDVTPDNIFITKDGTVKLLDFGAARYSLGNVSRSLDVILKHGFAPKEQYKRHGRQGPYTDVYSTAATIYYAITGAKPDDAIERSDEDTMPLPTTLGARITMAQESALLKGLAVQSENRYQTMDAFRNALIGAVQPEPGKKTDQESVMAKVQEWLKPMGVKKLPKWLVPVCAILLAFTLLNLYIASRGRAQEQKTSLGTWTQETVMPTETQQTEPKQTEEAQIPAETEEETYPETTAGTTIPAPTEAMTETTLETAQSTTPVRSYQDILDKYMSTKDDDWKNNVMKADVFYDISKLRNRSGGRVLGSQLFRDEIRSVTFLDTIDNAPYDAWCISEGNDGSVMAWVEENQDLYDLYIAGDGGVSAPENACGLFAGYDHMEEIHFNGNFHTENTTQMQYMFYACFALEELDVSDFDTSNATKMQCMFAWCKELEYLDLSNFDTRQVTDMGSMFMHCEKIDYLNLESFILRKGVNTGYMFDNCPSSATVIKSW